MEYAAFFDPTNWTVGVTWDTDAGIYLFSLGPLLLVVYAT